MTAVPETPEPLYRVIDTLPPDATIISTMNPEVWIRRDFIVPEVADLLGFSEDWVRHMYRDGKFPNARSLGGRTRIQIPGTDVQAMLEEQRIHAPGYKARRE